ncbi:membrane protein [Ktedonospora formicarum]|uniref:Membrane protein n=1 Tax=Ktedonospora formicarum TaxID=2778364 RepID=A0A8J3I4K3_9CHLR|nr:hypothetical protein [Ktedonospora formicarum]GHO46943.1 membrane protein [Ktedonospora formicarum]
MDISEIVIDGNKKKREVSKLYINSKVPLATFGFWLIKILATTFGEVGGNLVSMDMGLGYLKATTILVGLFALLAFVQIMTKRFHPFLYWGTIVASTTAGTTLADYVTRSLGIGYTGGSLLLLSLVIGSLITWRKVLGRNSADDILDRRAECFYWLTITFSQTLGTALGDWFADTAGLGYIGSSFVFGLALLSIVFLHHRRALNGAILFWAAFILTRPFGAVVGNFFDKPIDHGGLAVSRAMLTCTLFALMALGVLLFPQSAKKINTKNSALSKNTATIDS